MHFIYIISTNPLNGSIRYCTLYLLFTKYLDSYPEGKLGAKESPYDLLLPIKCTQKSHLSHPCRGFKSQYLFRHVSLPSAMRLGTAQPEGACSSHSGDDMEQSHGQPTNEYEWEWNFVVASHEFWVFCYCSITQPNLTNRGTTSYVPSLYKKESWGSKVKSPPKSKSRFEPRSAWLRVKSFSTSTLQIYQKTDKYFISFA